MAMRRMAILLLGAMLALTACAGKRADPAAVHEHTEGGMGGTM
jgi:hypothetical protein